MQKVMKHTLGYYNKETSGEPVQLSLLLVHAEDQLMNAEFLKSQQKKLSPFMNGLKVLNRNGRRNENEKNLSIL